MSEQWSIEQPTTIDIGGGEKVRRVEVAVVAGRVDVVTHDGSDTDARLEVHDLHGRPLHVSWHKNTVRVSHVVTDRGAGWWEALRTLGKEMSRATVTLVLSVPGDTLVQVGTVSAEAVVTGHLADVSVKTVSGDITISGVTGSTSVNTVSGAVELHQLNGPLTARTVSADITAHSSRIGPVSIDTVSGHVTLDLLDGTAQLKSASVSGDVTVRIPAGGGYDADIRTTSGDAVVDGHKFARKPGHGGGQLSDGDGALHLRATSVSGNVVVLRAQAQERPEVSLEKASS